MANARSAVLVLAAVAVALAGWPSLAADPPAGLESDNRAVVAKLVDNARIVINGKMTVAELFDPLARQGRFKYSLHAPYAKASANIQFWTTTIIEALVWIGDECEHRYEVGEQGELDIQPATDPPDKRCWHGGEGLSKLREPAP